MSLGPLRDPAIAAVILAAGMSRRMGRPKALLPIGDKTLIRRVAESISAVSSISPLIVVTGHLQAEVIQSLAGLPITFAHNPDYDAGGMLSSIQTGLRAIPEDTDAVLIMLGDQPTIRPDTVQSLINCWQSTQPPAVVPVYHEKRGHPVVICGRSRSEILALKPDQTLKTFMTHHERDLVELSVDDPATTIDVDTPADYEKMLEQYNSLEGQHHARTQP